MVSSPFTVGFTQKCGFCGDVLAEGNVLRRCQVEGFVWFGHEECVAAAVLAVLP